MSSTTSPFPDDLRSAVRSAVRLEPLKRWIARRAERWARQRQGSDRGITTLASRRVYILPTGVGLVFALMTFAMLLGSMNYNNNLSFVLTFLLVSLGLVSMHQCQRNLVGLELAFSGVDPVFAGQSAEFRIAITNRSRDYRYNLQIYQDRHGSRSSDLGPGESRVFVLEIPTRQRGYVELPRFGLRTSFPFELFRSWAWLHMDLRGTVYPHPADSAPEPPPSQSAQGHRQHDARGEEDFAGLREFHEGDPPKHVAWKAYARTGDLYSKQFSGADTSSQWFDFDAIDERDTERRLAILARWIIEADRRGQDYGLRIAGSEYPPAHGEAHRHACLERLALFDLHGSDRENTASA